MDSALLPIIVGTLAGVLFLALCLYFSRRILLKARESAETLLVDASTEAENRQKEILVAAQESALSFQEDSDRREREIEEREAGLEQRSRDLDRQINDARREGKSLQRRAREVESLEKKTKEISAKVEAEQERVLRDVQRIAGMTAEEARAELIREIEEEARGEASRLARKIEEEARENAERDAINLMIQASQRVNIRDVVESTVSFIELPSDEMKGRIIGREGRNIRALEMATGIDLIVDDTPRSILISSFDPLRREIARVAIDRLVEDGRIHPARIEEVVQRVNEEIGLLINEKGTEAAYGLGISDLHPKLLKRIGRTRYHTVHGQNLLQHCIETALIAGHMAQEVGGSEEVVLRAGLLHEIGQTDGNTSGHPILASAELCGKYGEKDGVVHAIRSLHPDVEPSTLEALLVNTANKMSGNRPGARKENLAVFIERLRRLEEIATGFYAVDGAYAVKAGKEIRVILNARQASDDDVHTLSKQIARALERDLSFPGQIKVSVIRETRAVRFAV
jgi:ribonuclease Y